MSRPVDDPPGGVLMWIIVAVELLTFGIGFFVIADLRHDPAFALGQAALDRRVAWALTALLVTSGGLAAEGVRRYRAGALGAARRWFRAAGAGGLGFLALKGADFAHHVAAGDVLGASPFWDAWWLATGFHAAHVVVGVILLFAVAGRAGQATFEDDETAIVGSALFWHLCDVVWFFLLPLLYARAA